MLNNKNYITYFSGYGPTSSNNSAYDDHIGKNIKNNKIDNPISLPNKYEEETVTLINELDHGVILISGTAGDGKTYLCRQIWCRLGKSEDIWNGAGNYVETEYASKKVIFIKDLSAVVAGSADEEQLLKLVTTTAKENNSTIVILATNDGQILEKYKNYTKDNSADEDILDLLENEFLEFKNNSTNNSIKIVVKDLRDICNSDYIEKAICEVTSMERWNSCQSCEINCQCPIIKNVEKLRTETVFKDRLISILQMLLAQGYHITTRNLLLLLSNIILGHNTVELKRKIILSCKDVKKFADENKVINSSVYLNAVGLNLTPDQRVKTGILSEISTLKIGYETSKNIDAFINTDYSDIDSLSSSIKEEISDYLRFLPDNIKAEFESAKNKYLTRDSFNLYDSEYLNNYNSALVNYRICLFFNVSSTKLFNIWDLSLYKNGGRYLNLLEKCRKEPTTNQIFSQSEIITGLNRIFTGYFTNESKDLYITTSGGYSNSKVCSIYLDVVEISGRNICILINLSEDRLRLPQITIKEMRNGFEPIHFTLTPQRYEFLTNIAYGFLSSSYSSECLDDLLAFKAIIVSAIEKLNAEIMKYDSNESLSLKLISLTEQGDINA